MRAALILLVCLSTATIACKKDGTGDAIAKMTELKDKMCACKDKACTDQVTQEMTRWASEHKPGEAGKSSEEEQKKVAALTEDISKCMMKSAGTGSAGSAGSGSASDGSSGAGSAGSAGAGTAGAGTAGAGTADSRRDGGSAAAGAGAGSSATGGETMAHRAGMCPSTVLGAKSVAAVKGKAVVVTIESADKDAIAAIQKRADQLLAEKKRAQTGHAHDQKGTYGGGQGLCPVHVPEGAKATARHTAKGVVVTITPRSAPDALAKEIEERIVKAADWVKANVSPGDQGNQGGVGGGKGQDGSNHSGKGDGKGHERKKGGGNGGGGGGKGTGGGGGKGTGGGDGTGNSGW